MARAPRPILKSGSRLSDQDQSSISPLPFASCSQSQLLQHHALHVHFPPTPHLARMEITHSPNTYDRAPIVVVPNDCAMPDRGCRSYGDGNRKTLSKPKKKSPQCGTGTSAANLERHQQTPKKPIESYFHPQAFEASSLLCTGSNSNGNGTDGEELEFENADANQCTLVAALPPSLGMIATTASWTPPLTRCSSPSPSSPLTSSTSSDMVVPVVPIHSLSQYHQTRVQQQHHHHRDGLLALTDNTEEMVSPSPATLSKSSSTASLNALALTLLPYIPPSAATAPPSSSSKSSKKKRPPPLGDQTSSSSRRKGRDVDCLSAYTRWSSPFHDPALDGCLGGF